MDARFPDYRLSASPRACLDRGEHGRAVRQAAIRCRAVRIGVRRNDDGARVHGLVGASELVIVERAVEGDDHDIGLHRIVRHGEAGQVEFVNEDGLRHREHASAWMPLDQIQDERVNGGDDVGRLGGNPEPGELAGVVEGGLERFVGHENDARARGPEARDDAIRPVDQVVAEIESSVEVEGVAAIERDDGCTTPLACHHVLSHCVVP